MGRAIDMEKDIDELKMRVQRLENITRGMSAAISEMEEKSTRTKHVDLVDDVKEEETDNGTEKKANNEGDGKRSKSSNKSSRKSNAKKSKSGSSSK